MLPTNGSPLGARLLREDAGRGLGPTLLGGWIGGVLLGALALWSGLGWLAALALYSLGGGLLLLAFALLPLVEIRLHPPVPRPAYVRVRGRL
jgi:hypothetical protein